MLVIRPNLPGAGAKYKCVFGNMPPIEAELKPDGLECKTPPVEYRLKIPPDQDHVQVDLAVRSAETNKDFVSRTFSFFNCSRHTRCRSCVKSAWGCNWCVHENRCVHDSLSCNSSSIVTGEKVALFHVLHQVSRLLCHWHWFPFTWLGKDLTHSHLFGLTGQIGSDVSSLKKVMRLDSAMKRTLSLLAV